MSLSRVLILAATAAFAWSANIQSANAQMVAQDLRIHADQTFSLQAVINGQVMPIKGSLHDANPASAKQGAVTATVGQYTDYVSVALAEDGHDVGSVFIFEVQNANYVLKNQRPIAARAASMNDDLKAVLDQLNQQNGWDATQALPAMLEFFRNSPDKQLSDFADQVELHRIKQLARPVTKTQPIQPAPAPSETVETGGVADVPPGQIETQPLPAPDYNGGMDDDQIALPGDDANPPPGGQAVPQIDPRQPQSGQSTSQPVQPVPARRQPPQQQQQQVIPQPRYVQPAQPQPQPRYGQQQGDDDDFYKPVRRRKDYFPPAPVMQRQVQPQPQPVQQQQQPARRTTATGNSGGGAGVVYIDPYTGQPIRQADPQMIERQRRYYQQSGQQQRPMFPFFGN